jgi:hypothetical protein
MDVLSGQQEFLSKYKKRFERYRDSMFTFLDEDEIPWNNNAAELALLHCVIWLFSVRFQGISLKKGQGNICDFLPLHKHAASKISHS